MMAALIGAVLAGFVAGSFVTVVVLAAIGRSVRGGSGSAQKIRMSEQISTLTVGQNGPTDIDEE